MLILKPTKTTKKTSYHYQLLEHSFPTGRKETDFSSLFFDIILFHLSPFYSFSIPAMTQESQLKPVDVASMEEIEAAWNYFTSLPKEHPNRIHVITEFSSPWERGTWYHYYTIRYRFCGKEKEIRQLGFRNTTAKRTAIHKIIKATEVNISEAPIPLHLPQRIQETIRDRRRQEIPREEKGKGEENIIDSDYDEFDLIMKEIDSWKTPEVEVVEID